MVDVSIRPAEPRDIPAIQHVAERAWNAIYDGTLPQDTIDTAIDEWYDSESLLQHVENPDVAYFVATDADRVQGYVTGAASDDPRTGELGAIYVHPDRGGSASAATSSTDSRPKRLTRHGTPSRFASSPTTTSPVPSTRNTATNRRPRTSSPSSARTPPKSSTGRNSDSHTRRALPRAGAHDPKKPREEPLILRRRGRR